MDSEEEASKPPMKTTAQVTRRISGSLVQETSREEIQAALHPEELVKSIVPGNGGLVASDSKIVASVLAANNLNSTGSDDGLTDKQRTLGRAQFLAICWALFLSGWTDGSTGPLLPRIQAVYKANFTIVSLMFVFSSIGFLIGAVGNLYLTHRVGFGKLVVIAAVCQVTAYTMQSTAPPFPVFVLAGVINGVGSSFENAQANGFIGALRTSPEAKMGFIHAAYGLGAFASPLVATQFAQLHRWSFHYLVSLGAGVINTVALILVFKLKPQDDCLRESGEILATEEKSGTEKQGNSESTGNEVFKKVLHTPVVHLLGFIVLVYVGIEVTIGGWIVSYIIHVRGGGPPSGYVSSGFFGGLTLGRVILLWVNKKVGEWRVMFIYGSLVIALEFVIWFVPSLVGDAIAASFVGFLLGPMHPIIMTQTSRILPRETLTASIGWITGFGFAGSAFFPFITGAIASKHGIKSLQPLMIALMSFMLFLWALVPRGPSRPKG